MRVGICVAAVALLLAMPASAGLYTDDLARCVVSKSSDADRLDLVRWMFGAMSVHPGVKDLAKTTPQQRDVLTKQASDLMIRLLTADCHAQAVTALKYEGSDSLRSAFEVLGKIAMQGLLSEPAVQESMTALDSPANKERFDALQKETGLPVSPPPR